MATLVDHGQREAGLPAHAVHGANACEQRQRLDVTAHQDVLAVVDALAGFWIGKGGGPSTQAGPGFEHLHARTGFGQRRGGTESGDPAANDYDVGNHARENRR